MGGKRKEWLARPHHPPAPPGPALHPQPGGPPAPRLPLPPPDLALPCQALSECLWLLGNVALEAKAWHLCCVLPPCWVLSD